MVTSPAAARDSSDAVARSLPELKACVQSCRRCPLYRGAIQGVAGEGPRSADLMLVGEQPGDQEDRMGRPFVGPAGRILDRALAASGIDRKAVYLTNAVKHFKNEPRGKRRLHRRPNHYEVDRCKWWLAQELAIVRPKVVVALGATAAGALAGRPLAIGKTRGKAMEFEGGQRGLVTLHPSAILRVRDTAERATWLDGLVQDLQTARQLVEA